MGLSDRFKMMPALTHGNHFFENTVLLATKISRGFGVDDSQSLLALHRFESLLLVGHFDIGQRRPRRQLRDEFVRQPHSP